MRRNYKPHNTTGGGRSSNSFKLKITRAALLPLCFILLCACVLLAAPFGGRNAGALNNTTVNSAYRIGEKKDGTTLTDLYDATHGIFVAEAVENLFHKITGNSAANLSDVTAYINNNFEGYTSPSFTPVKGVQIFGSKVVTAPTVNANAGNSNFGIVLKLKGEDWMVTSLTIDNDGNPIATLMLANPTKTKRFHSDNSHGQTTAAPSNMYSTSELRKTSLPSLYPGFSSGDWAQTYLVQPAKIKYQEQQNMTYWPFGYDVTSNALNGWGTVANDAWGTPLNANYTKPSYNYQNKAHYSDWKDDYIWIPSFTEMIPKVACNTLSIWSLTANQMSFGTGMSNLVAWTRSGQYAFKTSSTNLEAITANGSNTGGIPTSALYVRPAIHLNLAKVAEDAAKVIEKPTQPAGTVYNYSGLEQTLDLTDFTNYSADYINAVSVARSGGNAYAAPSVVAAVAPATNASKLKFTDAGTYEIKLQATSCTLPSGVVRNHVWSDKTPSTTGKETTVNATVKKRKIAVPSFTTTTGEKEYTGSKLTFAVPDYPNENIAATATEAYPRAALETVVKRTVNGVNAAYTDDFTYNTADNPKGLEIGATEAGLYSLTFKIKDTANYEWSGGTDDVADKTASFKIKPKQLTITYETTEENDALSWSADKDDSKATFTISGLVSGDSVGVKLKLSKENDAGWSAEAQAGAATDGSGNLEAVLDKSVFGGSYKIGSYPITFEITGSEADNLNYSLETALNGWTKKLVISAAGAGLSSYDWFYTKDGADETAVPAGASPFEVSYEYNGATGTGAVYELRIDDKDFADAHIAIDTSKYTNGYDGIRASAAGEYTAKVALKADTGYEFTLSDGSKSSTMDVELKWKIKKAAIDTAAIKWTWTDVDGKTGEYDAAEGLPWYGSSYTLTLSGLPSGVTVKNPTTTGYRNNKKKYIGNYTAECLGIDYDEDNYEEIPASVLNLDWKIVKGKIVIKSGTGTGSWTQTEQGTEGNIFYVPTLKNVNGVVYKYYDLDDGGKELGSITDITSTSGSTHRYYVKAFLSEEISVDGQTKWSDALELVDETGGDQDDGGVPLGDFTKYFETGDDRTLVQVTLNGAPFTYDGKAHAELKTAENEQGELEILVGGSAFPTSNFALKYYKYDEADSNHIGEALNGAPVNAGKYVVEIKLGESASEDYYASSKYIEFEIEKYKLDMSQAVWGYIDGEGNEIAYNPSKPLEFGYDADGNPVKYSPVLIGIPKGDEHGEDADEVLKWQMYRESGLWKDGADAVLVYGGDLEKSEVNTTGGKYTTTCSIAQEKLSDNIELTGLPFIGTTSLDWKIEARKIAAPKNDSTHTFTGETLDLLDFSGMNAEELNVYFEITGISYYDKDLNDTPVYTRPAGNDPLTDEQKAELSTALAGIKNAGTYLLSVRLKDNGANTKFVMNGVASTATSYSAKITVNKLKITVTGWTNPTPDNSAPWVPTYAEEYPNGLIENKYTDEQGNAVTAQELETRFNEKFKQTLGATAGNEDNIEIEYLNPDDSEKEFERGDDPSAIYGSIDRPKFDAVEKDVMYTGKEQSFLPEGLEKLYNDGRIQLFIVDEEGNETEVDPSYFTQKNAGKYKVVARIKGNFKWSDTQTMEDLAYEFEIEAAEITPEWKTDKDGKPVAEAPAGYEHLGEIYEYHYYDADGKEVSEKELQGGVEYTVGVSIKEEYKNNFILQDKTGNTPADGVVRSEDTYTPESTGLMQSVMGLPLWLWLIILIIILFLLILFIILIAKKRKKSKEAKALNAEKQEEKDRIEAEKREREEEKRRLQEEREEEKRRKEEERQEEKRRKEEEREEEKRRREEEREEEKRRREERMEDERRRMEDERRRREEMAAASALNHMANPMQTVNGMQGGMGMQQGAYMPPQMPMPPQPQPQMPMPQMSQYGQPQYPQYAPYVPQPQPPVQPQPQPQTVYVERSSGGSRGDGEAYARLHEYESRLRSLERELEEKRIESIRNEEHARAQEEMRALAEQRRREEELQRLRALQSEQSQRLKEEEARYRERYDAAREMRERRRELEEERLRALEEQIRRKEADNRALEARFRETYAPYPQEVIRYDDPNGRRR